MNTLQKGTHSVISARIEKKNKIKWIQHLRLNGSHSQLNKSWWVISHPTRRLNSQQNLHIRQWNRVLLAPITYSHYRITALLFWPKALIYWMFKLKIRVQSVLAATILASRMIQLDMDNQSVTKDSSLIRK